MLFGEKFIRDTLSDVSILFNNFPKDPQFSIDSRTVQPGDIFVALTGARSDGHDFIADVLAKGAAGVIMAQGKKHILDAIDKQKLQNKLVILVPNTESALISLAAQWRKQFEYPVVGITGSVGKTSTKETIAKILKHHGMNFLATQGNQNTKIGISLNILRMRAHHEAALFEVGISTRGEMAKLAELLRPSTGIITYIGHSHMEGLGSLADIAFEKRSLFKYFTDQSIGIINGDQALLTGVSYAHPVMKFGTKLTNQVQSRKIKVTPTGITFLLRVYKENYPISLRAVHAAAISHALGATAVAHLLKVPMSVIVEALEQDQAIAGRFEQLPMNRKGSVLINDCYNANPESMKAALAAFNQLQTSSQKIAVLGDMLELGQNSSFWHRQLGRILRRMPTLKRVILVGSHVEWTKKTCPVDLEIDLVPNWQEAVKALQNQMGADSVVLVKGSNGVGLQNLVTQFTQEQAK